MTFFSNQSVFDRLSATQTESSNRKRNQNQEDERPTTSATNNTSMGTFYSTRPDSTRPRSSRSRTVSSSLFNRLANTETYATASMKGKIQNPPSEHENRPRSASSKSSNTSFWHRMAYTETFSTAQLKGINSQDQNSTKIRNNKTSNSFFHRMAYSETFASASKKGLVDDSPQLKSTPSKSGGPRSDFFDRMSKTDTYATASMKPAYGYGKSQETPTRRSIVTPTRNSIARTNVWDRLSKSDTKSSSLKKKSAWDQRQNNSRFTPGITRSASARRQYLAARYHNRNNNTPRARTPEEVYSVASARSHRSEKSGYTARSNIADYASGRRATTGTPTTQNSSFMARLATAENKAESMSVRSTSSSPVKKSTSPRKSLTATTTTTTTAKKNRTRTSSPRSLKTSTTGSVSSFTSSRREVTSLTSKSTAIQSRSIKKAEPPKTKPAPVRPVLQFDSDDDFSYGESEDEEEFDVATGGKTNEKEHEVLSTSAGAATSTTAAPQDIFSKPNDDDQLTSYARGTTMEPIQSEDIGESMSVETASIDDILGDREEEKGETDAIAAYDANEENVKDLNVDSNDNNENDLIQFDDEDVNGENKDEVAEEELLPINNVTTDDSEQIMNGISKDPFEEESDIDGTEEDVDELDNILNEPEPLPEVDNTFSDDTQQADNEQNNIDNPVEEPVNLVESDDDFSYGDESLDEHEPEKPTEQVEQEAAVVLAFEQEEQHEEDLISETPQNSVSYEDEKDAIEANEMVMVEPPNQDMNKVETLDSLDILLDASSTIAEEIDENQEQVAQEDEQMYDDNPYDDGSLTDSIIEEEEEEYDEDEEAAEEELDEPEMEEEAEEALPPLRYKLLVSDKYHPEYGLEELYPEDLDLVDSLTAFEEGAISNHEVSVLIIEALFERDFENGEHWEIDPGTARDLEEDEGGGGDLEGCAFVVKRQARLDWNDLYSVAAAKGTIIISSEKDEIKIENYSYFVAG